MSDYYAPNQQVVRGDESGPAEQGDGGSPPVDDGTGGEAGEPTVLATADADDFDPAEHTVAEVQAYVAEHPDSAEAIATAEAEGKARTTLLGALEAEPE